MHIFDKDIADLCLSNVGDRICDGHKCTNENLSPHVSNNITSFLLVLTNLNNISNIYMKQKLESRVIRTWRSGGNSPSNSILFTIPVEYARKYHLSEPTNVLVISTDEGILLKRLEILDE